MKILFITNARGIDYLSDCIFHGLVTSGHEVIDSKYMWYHSPITDQQRLRLYGRGFTLSGLLPDRSSIDRSDLQNRIKARQFDVIIYGSVWRCRDYLDTVTQVYPKDHIIFLDGQDGVQSHGKYVINPLLTKGIYFKRQLRDAIALPISFSIPEQKILSDIVDKQKVESSIIPNSTHTYTYTKQQDYYHEYAISKFGLTYKKAGWDCLRHYEIIANNCLPYFKDFQNCPRYTMVNWPTELQRDSNAMFQIGDMSKYDTVLRDFFSYCKQNLTTKKSAQYVLSKVG